MVQSCWVYCKGFKMKINIISDLHLEFGEYNHVADAHVTIICGDICGNADESLDWMKSNFKDYSGVVIWVLGNHEFYNHETLETSAKHIRNRMLHDKELPSFAVLLDNEAFEFGGITFVGSTLWTDFNKDDLDRQQAQRYMNDYRMIKSNVHNDHDGKIMPKDTQEKFFENRAYINKAIAGKKNVVVITHHAPSYKSISDKYKKMSNAYTNPAFASDMDKMIENNPQIKLWCHGHTHANADYTIGKTRVVCNPRGYDSQNENDKFNKDLIIEMEGGGHVV